jgi:hypothetical protein
MFGLALVACGDDSSSGSGTVDTTANYCTEYYKYDLNENGDMVSPTEIGKVKPDVTCDNGISADCLPGFWYSEQIVEGKEVLIEFKNPTDFGNGIKNDPALRYYEGTYTLSGDKLTFKQEHSDGSIKTLEFTVKVSNDSLYLNGKLFDENGADEVYVKKSVCSAKKLF